MADGRNEEHDQLVLAGPANAMAPIARGLDQVLSYLLATVPYAGVVCINLAFRREQLRDLPQAAGFVVPAVEQRSQDVHAAVRRPRPEERVPAAPMDRARCVNPRA